MKARGLLQSRKQLICALLLLFAGGSVHPPLAWPGEDSVRSLHTRTQDPGVTVLTRGKTIPREISGGDTKRFSITLTAGDYAAFRVNQHGSVLVVSLYNPQNKVVIEMDTPAGGHGPIVFSTIASASGQYRLDVASRNKWTNPANFDITVEEVRPATPDDKPVVAAYEAFAEGRKVGASNRPAALAALQRSAEFWQEKKNRRWQALTHFALSQVYGGLQGGLPNAIKELEAGLEILNDEMAPYDWRLKASTLNDLGRYYVPTGEIQRGIDLLNQALDLYSKNQDRRGQASSLNNLAIAYGRFLGNHSHALELAEKSLSLRYEENDLPGATNLLNTMGGIADLKGEPEKALEYFSKAQRDWEKFPELPISDQRRLGTLTNLATIYDKLGQWERARDLYDKGLSMLGEKDAARIVLLDHKGELYASLGKVKEARGCYEEALSLLPPEKFEADVKASILVHLGQLSLMEEDIPAAVTSFEQARALKVGERRLAHVLTNLGGALASQEKLEPAIDAYQKALVLQEKSKDVRGQAFTLQRRGEAYDRLNKPGAVDDLKQALDLWKSVKDVKGTAATLNSLARAEQGRGNLVEALRYSDEAIDVVESQRMTLSSRELRTAYFATQENYFALNIQLSMQMHRSIGDTAYLARAFETNEKSRARVLLEALKEVGVGDAAGTQTSDKRLADLIEQRRTVLNKLAVKAEARTKLLNIDRKAVELANLDKEIDSLTEKSDGIDTQIRSLNPRFATLIRPRPATLKQIQQQLDQDTLLLEYSLGHKQSYAWTVTSDSIHGFALPAGEQIERAASRLGEAVDLRNLQVTNETPSQREARETKADKDYAEAARNLSNLVVAPVASEFRKKRLVIVPDGALQNVSFASLPAASHLIQNHEIVSLPSASVIAVLREQIASRAQAPNAIIVLANPVFGVDDDRVKRSTRFRSRKGSTASAPSSPAPEARQCGPRTRALESIGSPRIPDLPFSRREAQRILQVAPRGQAVAFLDFEANRSRALSPEMARYRFIHFATHGVIDLERPALSHIILSLVEQNGQPQDGRLLLHDIYSLNLPAELVVLSACQTGIGKQVKGEGLIALTRGFMYAGAARLVASYWDVDDAATAELMAEFYKEMFVNGKRPAEALQAAQLHLRRQPRWNAPIYWAGFFIQGEWK